MQPLTKMSATRIGGYTAALFAIGFLTLANSDPEGLNWSLEAWAAWVQAVGSVAAIAVAIAVPYGIAKRDRQERAERDVLRARSHALLLGHRIDRLTATLRTVRRELDQNDPDTDHYQKFISDLEGAMGDWVLQSHELGLASGPLQGALAEVTTLTKIFDEWDFYFRYGPYEGDAETGEQERMPDPPAYGTVLSKALNQIEIAASDIHKILRQS